MHHAEAGATRRSEQTNAHVDSPITGFRILLRMNQPRRPTQPIPGYRDSLPGRTEGFIDGDGVSDPLPARFSCDDQGCALPMRLVCTDADPSQRWPAARTERSSILPMQARRAT